MIIKMILIIMIIIAVLMYLVIVGADKCKTKEERKVEEQEEMKALAKWRE